MKISMVMCLAFVSVMVMVVKAEGKKKSQLLTNLCEKCEYCEGDPSCSGCARCGECKTRKDYGCKFCKKGEAEEKCVDRCTKGCRVCKNLESCKERK